MRISQTLRNFHLHDSGVHDIRYQPEAQRLEVVIDLCDWSGEAGPEEVFGQSGRLVFEGVTRLESAPALENLSWNENYGLEVLDLEHKPELDTDGLEGVWGLFELPKVFDDQGRQAVLILEFVATHFEWFPET
ncbi:MAG: hypothetical protein GYB65_11850 [Chloroflexi bacterium]|nr:hypothetical protein [Chloroflexota bacterium]